MKIATMLLALCCISAVPPQSGPPSKGDIFLTLASQTVWQARDKWCTFSAEIVHGIGSLSEECGGALLAGKGAGPSKRRTLSRAEAQKLRTLYDGARLFEAAAAGAIRGAAIFHFLF